MNPATNKFEPVTTGESEALREHVQTLKKSFFGEDGSEIPEDWPVFNVGQELTLRGYRWRVGSCRDSTLTLEAVGPLSKGQQLRNKAKRRRRSRRR